MTAEQFRDEKFYLMFFRGEREGGGGGEEGVVSGKNRRLVCFIQ